LEIVDRELDIGSSGDGQQVKHGIGGTSQDLNHRDRVEEGGTSQNVPECELGSRLHVRRKPLPWLDVTFKQHLEVRRSLETFLYLFCEDLVATHPEQ
jgi:hypothetical protein